MIWETSHDRKVFMAYYLDKIQIDAARGKGEYLATLTSLYQCNEADMRRLSVLLQFNYA